MKLKSFLIYKGHQELDMIHAELILANVLDDRFHGFVEQLTGYNTASIVQSNKRPRGKMALILAYFKAFANPISDTSDVSSLLGMLHFGILCAGPELDMAEINGFPHDLRSLQAQPTRQGAIAVIYTGDGQQWGEAIEIAKGGSAAVQEWGHICRQQFVKHDLIYLMEK